MLPILQHITTYKQDGILWQARTWTEAATSPHAKGQAVRKVAELLAKIPDMLVQQSYIDALSDEKSLGIKAKPLKEALADLIDTGEEEGFGIETDRKLPAYIDKEAFYTMGFCEVQKPGHIGYYSMNDKGGAVQSSNFVIKPIFHVSGKAEDSRHIFEVWNGVKRALMDVPSKVFVSKETLSLHLVAEGAFIFFGSAQHLLRISSQLLPEFPLCHEIKQLGWQREGFFAYADKIFVPGRKKGEGLQEPGQLADISKWGIIEVGGTHFLIPAASEVYANQRQGDDPHKLARAMSWKAPKVQFREWAKQMHIVYGDKGLSGIAFAIATAFRDVLFRVNHNFPHLYGYGERASGKSQWAASICALFYNDRAPYNVNSGTDFAFFSYMQAFVNALANLNEVDDKVLKPEWFQAIKGVFDGEGRMRGKMGSRTAIEIQQVESGLVLIGQYISTLDDNSLVSRSCVEAFAERQYTDEEKAQFMKLTEWQKEGLTGLLPEVLQRRPLVEAKYYDIYNQIVNTWRRATKSEFNQRIFQNWAHLSAVWSIFERELDLPVSTATFDQYCYGKAVEYSRFIRSSDTLTDFWNTVSFLLDQQLITDGWDFRIKFQSTITLRSGDGKESKENWDQPRKLLMIRLNNVHKLFQQAKNKAGERNPMTLENLKHYFSTRPYYIGQVKQQEFKRYVYKAVETPGQPATMVSPATAGSVQNRQEAEKTITSAFVFDYDLLGCDLERTNGAMEGISHKTALQTCHFNMLETGSDSEKSCLVLPN